MRKFFLISSLIFPILLNAQARLVLKAGINHANVSFKYDDGRKGKNAFIPRFNGGVVVEIPLEDNWFLYTGANYSGKGYIQRFKRSTSRLDSIKVRLNYIELPLTVGYKFSNEKFTLNWGIYFGYGFNGERSYNLNLPEPEKHLHLEGEEFKRFDFGFNLGGVYQPTDRFGIKLDYSRSLFNVCRYIGKKEKHMVFGLSFFWYLNKKKATAE